MRVRYQAVNGKLEPYYICTEKAVRRADKPCQSMRGCAIDDAIGALILDSVTPVAIELTLAIEDEIAGRIEQAATQRITQLTRARYDAELYFTRSKTAFFQKAGSVKLTKYQGQACALYE